MQRFAVITGNDIKFLKLNSDGRRQLRRKNENVKFVLATAEYRAGLDREAHAAAVERKRIKAEAAEKMLTVGLDNPAGGS